MVGRPKRGYTSRFTLLCYNRGTASSPLFAFARKRRTPKKEPLPAVTPREKSDTPPLFDTKDSPINLKRTKSNEEDPMCLNDCSHLPRSSE